MLLDANLEALRRCVRNNEKAPGFDLSGWVQECGTYGCLVGNDFIAQNGIGSPDPAAFIIWAMNEYSLPRLWAGWLFSCWVQARSRNGIGCSNSYGVLKLQISFKMRPPCDKDAAINRILKLIRYVERKRAIMYEADGRVSELARRQEGNWGVCASVLNSLAVAT